MIIKVVLVIYIIGLILTALLLELLLRQRSFKKTSDQVLAGRIAQAFASLLWPGFVISIAFRNLTKKRTVN